MIVPFFPSPVLGWAFLALLLTLLAIASVIDLRHYLIPKWISISILAFGVSVNVAGGAWLGFDGQTVWKLGGDGAFSGALDGFLFALCGFLAGFALFFVMWTLNVCGGGDVKLFAALGACIGPYFAILVLAVSLPVILALSFGQIALSVVRGHWAALRPSSVVGSGPAIPNRKRKLGFSLPLTIATVLVMVWEFRK